MITSTANPEIKRLARLGNAAERRAQARFAVEGRRAIEALVEAGWTPQGLWLREDQDPPPTWDGPPPQRVSPAVAERLSQQRTPSGWFATFPLPEPATLDPAAGGLLAVAVADPGNLGTLLRSAAAFGLGQVRLVGGADPFGPKAVQASAGCLARLRIRRDEADPAELVADLGRAAATCALVASGGAEQDLPPPPAWLVVGSEAHGLPPAVVAGCRYRLTLPMPGGAESLNAGVAGSIACFLVQGLHRPR